MEKFLYVVLHLITGDRFIIRYEGDDLNSFLGEGTELSADPEDTYRFLAQPKPQTGEMQVMLSRIDADILEPATPIKFTKSNILIHYGMAADNEIIKQLKDVDQQISARKSGLVLPGNAGNISAFPKPKG
jgi:hypothetical protein